MPSYQITNQSALHFSAEEISQIRAFIHAQTVNTKAVIIEPRGTILIVLDSNVKIPFALSEIFSPNRVK